MMNDLDLDLSQKPIAEAFGGNKVGDACTLENVELRVKRISMSHDDEYKDGKPTGKKVARGSITFEVLGFDYGDHSYDLGGDKAKDSKAKSQPEAAMPMDSGSLGKTKPKAAVAVMIGLGKKGGKY